MIFLCINAGNKQSVEVPLVDIVVTKQHDFLMAAHALTNNGYVQNAVNCRSNDRWNCAKNRHVLYIALN